MEKAVTDQFSQDEIDGLAADDPRFDAALDLRIEMLRGLLGAMEVSFKNPGAFLSELHHANEFPMNVMFVGEDLANFDNVIVGVENDRFGFF